MRRTEDGLVVKRAGQRRRGELAARERASSVAAGALVGHHGDHWRSALVRGDGIGVGSNLHIRRVT